jgi:hypothetical protein
MEEDDFAPAHRRKKLPVGDRGASLLETPSFVRSLISLGSKRSCAGVSRHNFLRLILPYPPQSVAKFFLKPPSEAN